jgi:hypothetical protein
MYHLKETPVIYIATLNGTATQSDLCKYYDFNHLCKDPTHRRGGLIDLCYTNIHSEDVILSQIPVYYILGNFAISTFSYNIKARKETS